jgi:hypothetical protein
VCSKKFKAGSWYASLQSVVACARVYVGFYLKCCTRAIRALSSTIVLLRREHGSSGTTF